MPNHLRSVASEAYTLPDGSRAVVEWLVPAGMPSQLRTTFEVRREVDGQAVWGQVFTPDPRIRRAPDEVQRLLTRMRIDPSTFDRRPIHCVVCGAAAERGCSHQPARH